MIPHQRQISWAIQGEAINRLAREKCHQEYDIPYAVDLLTSCIDADGLSEGDRLLMAVKVLDGTAEIQGVAGRDDYRFAELPGRTGPSLTDTLSRMRSGLAEKDGIIRELLRKLECCGEQLGSRGRRQADRAWSGTWGGQGRIFGEPAVLPARKIAPAMSAAVDEFLDRAASPDASEDYGWLEPSGEFHPVEWGEHEDWACKQVKARGWMAEWGQGGNASIRTFRDFLIFAKGWVLLHSPGHGLARVTGNEARRLTKAQKEFLFAYYMKRDHPGLAREYLED